MITNKYLTIDSMLFSVLMCLEHVEYLQDDTEGRYN